MGYTGPVHNPAPSGQSPIWEYGYVPSLEMGIIGVILNLVTAANHLWFFVKIRGVRSVYGLLFFACVVLGLGFGARLYSHGHPFSGMGFLVGLFLLNIGTILITASIYKSIQRAIKYTPHGESLCPMRPRSLLTVFIILDTVWVFMQMIGQYLVNTASADSYTSTSPPFSLGTSTLIFLSGNVLQSISITIVNVFTFVMYKRAKRMLARADPNVQYPFLKPLFIQIMVTFSLFNIRLLIRIAEGIQGLSGYAATHEWVFGVFEFAPIVVILNLWAMKPLFKYIFPFGHKPGQGAHTRNDIAAAAEAGATVGAISDDDLKADLKAHSSSSNSAIAVLEG